MANIPPPPVPPRLREMLEEYPELIQKIQGDLNSLVEKMLRGPHFPPFEEAVWYLEDKLEAFYGRAQKQLEAAEARGDLQAIDKAKERLHLIGYVAEDRPWNDDGEQSLWDYFQTYKAAFE